MKEYLKPVIIDEYIEIDDIVLASPGDGGIFEGGAGEED